MNTWHYATEPSPGETARGHETAQRLQSDHHAGGSNGSPTGGYRTGAAPPGLTDGVQRAVNGRRVLGIALVERGGVEGRDEIATVRFRTRSVPQRKYRNEVPQHHHRDLPSSRAVWHSSVLSHQHGCGCVKFGTKRPQVQILSPRPCFRRPEALTRIGEGLSCCQYRSKIPPVPQQIRTFDLLIEWAPPAGAALRSGRRGRRLKPCHLDQSSRRSSLKERAKRLSTPRRSPCGGRSEEHRHRSVCVARPMITRGGLPRPPAALRKSASRREPSCGGHRPDRIEQ